MAKILDAAFLNSGLLALKKLIGGLTPKTRARPSIGIALI
jgi:hypothetical protein